MNGRTKANADEDAIRELWNAGKIDEAATRALRSAGPRTLGLISAVLGDPDDADDVFSVVAEQFWRTFANFRWECSIQTWLYTIARREATRFKRRPPQRLRADLSTHEFERAMAAVKTEAQSFLRTGKRSALVALRDHLEMSDRTLLILRVDRELSWEDVARVFLEDDAPAPDALKRESARLRQQFAQTKAKLLALAVEQGLVER